VGGGRAGCLRLHDVGLGRTGVIGRIGLAADMGSEIVALEVGTVRLRPSRRRRSSDAVGDLGDATRGVVGGEAGGPEVGIGLGEWCLGRRGCGAGSGLGNRSMDLWLTGRGSGRGCCGRGN
jgi:hypothetical protein